ncbi:HAMP domain-containing sensor histidine kinase [Pseudogracilibacillus sp. SE30717A]|uniref:sensor histidine kinase n=1 Tax=Pseudogracilibacillus sp. SE30717A TaxID=3098293 RepID=UPI00300E1479
MKSLYGKFLFFTIGIMISSALIAYLIVNTYYHQHMRAQNDEKNMTIVENIADFIHSQNDDVDLEEFLSTQSDVGYKLILFDEEANKMLFGNDFRLDNLPVETVYDVLSGKQYHGMRDLPKETFVTGYFSDESANTVGTPFTYKGKTYALFLRPDIKMLFSEVHILLAGLSVGMAIISLIAMLFVARKLIQPISVLTEATKKVGAEQFSFTLPTNRGDEIGELATSFQKMADQLRESDEMRKQFINDVSHDFQTPLQNIKGYAALIRDEQTTKADRKTYTEIITSETERLSELTKQLLVLTSLDSLSEPLKMKEVHLDQQLKEVLTRYRWLMEDKGISLTAEISPISIHGNAAYLEKVWENILSNALKYSSFGGTIKVTVFQEESNVIIVIKDTGIGIKSENIPLIFNRFYRVDEARHSGIEGTGLGLAIVQQVVELHNGTINIDSKLGIGTTFTIRLPIEM